MNELLRTLLYLPPQSSTVALDIDTLHYSVILITMFGSFAVAAFALYFVLRYRRRAGQTAIAAAESQPDQSSDHTRGGMPLWLECSFIAFLLILFCTWWVIGFRQFVRLEVPPRNAYEIYVTGKQWMWTFAYPNGRGSNAVLYVPANRPIKLTMSSRDVIHSFYVPEFRVKKDVIPGRATTLWFEARRPGSYDVYCTEYCGEGHSTMRARVVALEEQEYLAHLEGLPRLEIAGPLTSEPAQVGDSPPEELTLAEQGQRVAVKHGCLRCHTVDGTPHIGPTWRHAYNSDIVLEDGARIKADAAYMTESMMDPHVKIHRGFEPVMPSYQGLLSAAEAGALLQYMRWLSKPAVEQERLAPLPPADAPPIRLPRQGSVESLGAGGAGDELAAPPDSPPMGPPDLGKAPDLEERP